MTYFNDRIFNKQNLKEEDKRELDYWESVFVNIIENAKDDYCEDDIPTIEKIKSEIIEDFCERLREDLGFQLQDNVVAIIDNYEDDVEEVENPDTYYYKGEENGDSEES